MIPVYPTSHQDVIEEKLERLGDPHIGFKEEKVRFSKPISTSKTSHGTQRMSTAGKPEASAAETNPFAVLGEKALSPPSAPSEVKGNLIQRRKSGDPAHPVEAPPPLIISMSRHPRPALTRRKAK